MIANNYNVLPCDLEDPIEARIRHSLQFRDKKFVTKDILLINVMNEEKFKFQSIGFHVLADSDYFPSEILTVIKNKSFPLEKADIQVLDEKKQQYYFLGQDPIDPQLKLPYYKNSIQIVFRFQQTQNNALPVNKLPIAQKQIIDVLQKASKSLGNPLQQYKPQQNNSNNSQNEISASVKEKLLPREKRVKERKIGYVYDKVMQWRKLYEEGYKDPNGESQKVNLDLAASMVGLSRKTLDDYYAQIKKAEQNGFDFDLNSNAKMGILRKFVKEKEQFQIKEEDFSNIENQQPIVQQNIKGNLTNNNSASPILENNEIQIKQEYKQKQKKEEQLEQEESKSQVVNSKQLQQLEQFVVKNEENENSIMNQENVLHEQYQQNLNTYAYFAGNNQNQQQQDYQNSNQFNNFDFDVGHYFNDQVPSQSKNNISPQGSIIFNRSNSRMSEEEETKYDYGFN